MGDQDRCQRKHSCAGDSSGALSWLGTLLWPLPSQDRDPLSQAQEKPVSPPGRGQAASLELVSTSHFPIFHLVSPSSRSPQEGQALPLHPVAPAKKKATGLSWSKGRPLASGKQRPRKSKGCAQVTQQGGTEEGFAAAPESWQNYGFGCRLAEPHTTQQPLLAHECGLPHRSPWQTYKENA